VNPLHVLLETIHTNDVTNLIPHASQSGTPIPYIPTFQA
jgi:hypothetical protein